MGMTVQAGVGPSSIAIRMENLGQSQSANSSLSLVCASSADASSHIGEESSHGPITSSQTEQSISCWRGKFPWFLMGISSMGLYAALLLYFEGYSQKNGKDESTNGANLLTSVAPALLLIVFMPLLMVSSVYVADNEN